jgi:hypothetical protein
LRARYEDLRSAVLSVAGGANGSFGLTLFLREGMAAWLNACAESVFDSQRPHQAGAGTTPMPGYLQTQATRILVTMALEGHWRVAR